MKKKPELFRLKELIAIGIGGMIGGGIFSVLGLAVDIGGHAAPLAFLISGLVALAAGYSYVKLALTFPSDGSSFIYLERAFPKIPNLAGVLGWIIVLGYIGTLALYAYTFGIYASDLFGQTNSLLVKDLLSSTVLIFFMVINLLGVKETGISADIAVYSKITILTLLGIIGFFSIKTSYYLPLFNKGKFSVFTAAAITFVAYEGFQLITNAINESEKPTVNIPRGIYYSIIIVTVIYFLLAVMSIGNLSEHEFNLHGEYALAVAVYPTLGKLGRILIDIAAIFATSSAINATIFGSSRMSAEIAAKKMMPKAFSLRNRENTPWFAITFITFISIFFSFFSDLKTIATYSSLTFLIVSIGVAVANTKLYVRTHSNLWLSLLGLVLMSITSVMLVWYLSLHNLKILSFIIVSYSFVTIVELIINKRKL